jgi:hypothetical protein
MRKKLTYLALGLGLTAAALVSGVKPAEAASNCVTTCNVCCQTCCRIGTRIICTQRPC